MEKTDITIIGAGIVGLAVAEKVTKKNRSVYILEKNPSFGMETSSRNSEVIHSGIYYPEGSLRHHLCLRGNIMLYNICSANGINFVQTGKYIAALQNELDDLHELFLNARKNEVPGVEILSGAAVRLEEPDIKCKEAVFSPTAGIVDSHALMEYFLNRAKTAGADAVFETEVTGIEKLSDGYEVEVRESSGENFKFKSQIIINCAGLNSDTLAAMAGIDVTAEGLVLNYCKGSYFRISNPGRLNVSHLIYPVVKKDSVSLGVHVTPDLGGGIRLGPDAEYIKRCSDYTVDESKKGEFFKSVSRFLRGIEEDELYPDTSGIRPKLQGPGEGYRDFVIRQEKDRGLPGFINLAGIDSPGLTASPAIAEMVADMADDIL